MSKIPPQNSRIREREFSRAVANVSQNTIQVQDLYEGAYLLCRGFQLKDLTVISNNGKPVVTFVIVGDDVLATANEYRYGRAMANVAILKFTMEKLKDQMFAKIREQEKRNRRNADNDNQRDQRKRRHCPIHS